VRVGASAACGIQLDGTLVCRGISGAPLGTADAFRIEPVAVPRARPSRPERAPPKILEFTRQHGQNVGAP